MARCFGLADRGTLNTKQTTCYLKTQSSIAHMYSKPQDIGTERRHLSRTNRKSFRKPRCSDLGHPSGSRTVACCLSGTACKADEVNTESAAFERLLSPAQNAHRAIAHAAPWILNMKREDMSLHIRTSLHVAGRRELNGNHTPSLC